MDRTAPLFEQMQTTWDEIVQKHGNDPDLTTFQRKKVTTLSQHLFHNVKDRLTAALSGATSGAVEEPEDKDLKRKVDELENQLEELVSRVVKYRHQYQNEVEKSTLKELELEEPSKVSTKIPPLNYEKDAYNDAIYQNFQQNLKDTFRLTNQLTQSVPELLKRAQAITEVLAEKDRLEDNPVDRALAELHGQNNSGKGKESARARFAGTFSDSLTSIHM